MKRCRGMAAALLCGLLLSGCGEEFPTLTQEEYDLIVDYSAGVLSKYTMGGGDKLTRVTPLEEGAPEEAEEAPATAKVQTPAAVSVGSTAAAATEPTTATADREDEAAIAAAETPENTSEETQTSSGTAVIIKDTIEEDASAGAGEGSGTETESTSAESASAGSADAVEIGSGDLLQKLQSGVEVALNGYYVLNSYPDSAAKNSMVLTADAGNKLLILSFSLSNQTGGTVDVDFLDANPTFTLLVNGQPVSKNLVTLLDNDMSTYAGSLAAGETTGVVLCFSVKEEQAKAIETLDLRMSYRGEEQTLRIE